MFFCAYSFTMKTYVNVQSAGKANQPTKQPNHQKLKNKIKTKIGSFYTEVAFYTKK